MSSVDIFIACLILTITVTLLGSYDCPCDTQEGSDSPKVTQQVGGRAKNAILAWLANPITSRSWNKARGQGLVTLAARLKQENSRFKVGQHRETLS